MKLFKKKNYIILGRSPEDEGVSDRNEEPVVPDGMWVKCSYCKKLIYKKEMNLKSAQNAEGISGFRQWSVLPLHAMKVHL